MSFVQTYILSAAVGQERQIEDVMRRLAIAVRALSGCENIAIFRDEKTLGRYVFMERFTDSTAHRESAAHVPKTLLSELMGLLAGKPEILPLTTMNEALGL